MKHLDEKARYFRLAFQAEIKAGKRGIQKKLAEETGISLGLICDINRGRTRGTVEKHELLAKALGYDYENFIAKGRQIERAKLGVQAAADITCEGTWEEKFQLAQKLIVAQERLIAEMAENSRLRLENEALKKPGWKAEGLLSPSAEDARSVPAADAE